MAVADIHLKLTDIEGESRDDKHSKELHIEHWSMGVSNHGSAHRGGGAGTSRADLQDLSCQMTLDKASPNLWLNCCIGKHISEVVLTQRESGETPQEYLKITLNEVLISSYQMSSSGGAKPGVSFSLNFAKAKFEYSPQKEDGSLDAKVTQGFDVAANKKV